MNVLDKCLLAGYFRAGPTIRRTRFLYVNEGVYSTVWTRVPLQEYTLKKRQRKLWRKVLSSFTVKVEAYQEREDQNTVYDIYAKNHRLQVSETLQKILEVDPETNIFNTYIVRILEGEKLVGFSCFDIGKQNIASLVGAFLPEYQKFSLGFFSMLAEMEWGKLNGMTYYFPGYSVPGLRPFAYKDRLPDLQGRNYLSNQWFPYSELSENIQPHERIRDKLLEAKESLIKNGFEAEINISPFSELFTESKIRTGAVIYPYLLVLTNVGIIDGCLYMIYDLIEKRFELWVGSQIHEIQLSDIIVDYEIEFPNEFPLHMNFYMEHYSLSDVRNEEPNVLMGLKRSAFEKQEYTAFEVIQVGINAVLAI